MQKILGVIFHTIAQHFSLSLHFQSVSPVYTAAAFPVSVLSRGESLVQTGLKGHLQS